MARGFSADEETREAANTPETFKLICLQREKFNGLIGPGIKDHQIRRIVDLRPREGSREQRRDGSLARRIGRDSLGGAADCPDLCDDR